MSIFTVILIALIGVMVAAALIAFLPSGALGALERRVSKSGSPAPKAPSQDLTVGDPPAE